MKTEPVTDIAYALSPKDVTALARAIINHADLSSAGRVTYLKSLLAGVQVELLGKPVLRALRGNHKAPDTEAALAALEKVNATYYEAVLAAVPDGLDALERNSKTSVRTLGGEHAAPGYRDGLAGVHSVERRRQGDSFWMGEGTLNAAADHAAACADQGRRSGRTHCGCAQGAHPRGVARTCESRTRGSRRVQRRAGYAPGQFAKT
jgi:hypothetical protein